MDPASMLAGRTRETTIFRDARGRWFHDGRPLEHQNLTRSFDRWIERADDGRYCLRNDINWAYFTLEGPPFFVRALRIESGGRITLRLSDDREEPLRSDTLRQDRDGVLYCDVRDGTMAARFDPSAAQQLSPLLGEDDDGVYVELSGKRVRPPVTDDPLKAP